MIQIEEYTLTNNSIDIPLSIEPYAGFLCGIGCENGMVCGAGCGNGVGGACGLGCSKG